MKRRSRSAEDRETVICASCLAPVSRSETFCHECGAPVGDAATLDPLGAVQAQGFLYRKALEGRPKLFTLVCVWALNLPVFVGGIYGAIYVSLHSDAVSGFAFFWLLMGFALLSFAILYRITKNYVTIPKKRWEDDDEQLRRARD